MTTTPTRVTYTNFLSEARNNIIALLENRSNVADPVTVSTEYRKWIYSREPDIVAQEFKNFPLIIIYPAASVFAHARSLDMKRRIVEHMIRVEVVASDREYNNKNAKGMEHLDAISDNVLQTLHNTTNRNTLQANGLYNIEVDTEDVAIEELNNTLVYRRGINIKFMTRKRVSV